MPHRLGKRPVLAALAGACAIAFSAILFRLSHVSPSTGAFFRCLFALPPLWVLARREDALYGRRPAASRRLALVAGVLLAVDLVCWHWAVEEVGAGLATVLGNLQVVLVGALAWAVLRERPPVRALAAIPIALGGVVLISGVVGSDAYGRNPALGVLFGIATGFAYASFLLVLREGSRDLRRPAGPLFEVTLTAAAGSAVIGAALGELDPLPGPAALGWLALLALTSQVVGWLIITTSLPRLPAALTSVLLTLQPVLSVLFAAAILGEAPSELQLLGVAVILTGLLVASSGRRKRQRVASEPAYAAELGD